MIRLAPDWLINRQVMRMHQGFRSRYYRRLVRLCGSHARHLAGCGRVLNAGPSSRRWVGMAGRALEC